MNAEGWQSANIEDGQGRGSAYNDSEESAHSQMASPLPHPLRKLISGGKYPTGLPQASVSSRPREAGKKQPSSQGSFGDLASDGETPGSSSSASAHGS